jgi:cell division protein FtsZ
LLEDSRITGSRGILINITGSSRLGFHEVNEACSIIREAAAFEEVMVSFGVILNEAMGESVKVTVIATGFQPENAPLAHRRNSWLETEPVIVRQPDPEPVERQPEPVAAEAEPVEAEAAFDPDDLEVPAYLRQGRLLN